MASSIQGEPRSTNDIDLVVDLHEERVKPLAAALGPEFDVDEEALRRAVRERSCPNVFFLPHLTKFRSGDLGKTWKEASCPPAFRKAPEGEKGRVVDHTFWLTPGHAAEKGTWYAGTSPQGLFRSEDGGVTWEPLPGLNEDPRYLKWMGSPTDGTPACAPRRA